MTRCKDCIHSGLCRDMHKFGIVDLPYNDDGAICEHFNSIADITREIFEQIESNHFGIRDEDSGEYAICIYAQEYDEIKKKYIPEEM